MPLSKDPQGGGSESDGGRSTVYCSKCFRDGRFTRPDVSLDEMTVLVKNKLREMGIPRPLAYLFVRGLPKLQRWHHPPPS